MSFASDFDAVDRRGSLLFRTFDRENRDATNFSLAPEIEAAKIIVRLDP